MESSPAEKGTTVFFNGTGSDSDGTIVAYEWTSDIDGVLSDEEDFSTTGLSVGNHTITFRVQDNDGLWSDPQENCENCSTNASVSGISLWIYAAPVANAGENVSITPNVLVQFSGAGTDKDGNIVNYEWDFDGNGVYEWSSSENGLTTYVYNNEGTFTAVLRVTDNDGFTATDSRIITVSKAGGDDDDGLLPAPSLAAAVAAVAVIALRRRHC
jgi:PKD repeat protein